MNPVYGAAVIERTRMTAPRFGISIIPSASGRSDPVAEAVHAEELGFDLVTIWDHPHGEHPSFETWTLMTWIAARTNRIRVASDVLGLPLRLPALTAKMAESLDRLSDGRLILGLGGGGSDAEFAGYGAPIRTGEEKVEALEEAVALIRAVWSDPELTFEGRHYRTERTLLEPKPLRAIPIWLGTYGPRAREITGRMADGWIPSLAYLPLPSAKRNIADVRAAAERAGRDPGELDYALNVGVRVGGPPPPDADRRLGGEPDEITEGVLEILNAGFTVANFFVGGRREDQAERLATEILPVVRQTAT
jgi:alkanesulfonate monooxygenase SsuD/methylene tetrahydromethanopterin reductase-like flavin-dependent oxidoreductase (luciferase family)